MQDADVRSLADVPAAPSGPLSAAAFSAALQLAPQPTLFIDDGHHPSVVWGNLQAHRFLEVPPTHDLHWSQLHPELAAAIGRLLDAGGGFTTVGAPGGNGAPPPVTISAYPDAAVPTLFIVHLQERSEAQRLVEERQVAEARFRAVALQAPVGILASEAGLRVAFANTQAADLLGHDEAAIRGLGWMDAVDADHIGQVTDALATVFDGETTSTQFRAAATDRWLQMVAGPVHPFEHSAGFVATLEDVTRARDHRAALQHQATHDGLTGLANRGALLAALEHAREALGSQTHALLFFDLDHFKFVNDALGHTVGDRLLVEIATRFRQRVRAGDVVARFGGDEFVLLCHDLSGVEDAVTIAERYATTFEHHLLLEGRPFRASASIGVALAEPCSHWTPVSLLRDADAAMYQAKEQGRNRIAVFDARGRGRARQRLQVATDLRGDLARDRLTLAYQPIVHTHDGSVMGSEALLRWRHTDHGDLPIPQLIELAEETGLLSELSAWVLDAACRQLAEWRAMGKHAGWIAVNVSGTQLTENGFVDLVLSTLRGRGLLPTDLYLELTESVLIDPEGPALDTLRTLRAGGVRIALDDFGTGWSSLSYLRTMPVDLIKIAAPFVARIDHDPSDAAIVAAITQMVRAAGRDVLAEGVETRAQLECLIHLGCDTVQGFVYGRPGPEPADRFPPWPELGT